MTFLDSQFCILLKILPSLIPRPHPLTRRNGLGNQVEFLGLAHSLMPSSPRFSVLQATESWVGPGNEASLMGASPLLLEWLVCAANESIYNYTAQLDKAFIAVVSS